MSEAKTLVLADDSALLREGLVGLLERQGFKIIAHVSDATQLDKTLTDLADNDGLPDALVTDVRMPPNMSNDGLEVAIEFKEKYPQMAVMVLSQYVAPGYAQQLFALPASSGGTGYLLKDRISEVVDFISSLRLIISGGVVIDPQVAQVMMNNSRMGLGSLTARETEVLELMAQGLSNNQIAQQLVLSAAAVAKHVSNIFSKLGLEPGEENRRVRAILTFLAE